MNTRLAAATLRHRIGAFAGTFLTSLLAITLLAGSGLLLFSVLTAGTETSRFGAADAVIAGDRAVTLSTEKNKGDRVKVKTKSEQLTGAAALPAGLAGTVANVPGVAHAVPDTAFPVALEADGRALQAPERASVMAHGWQSAQLAPFNLTTGTAPRPGEVVLEGALTDGIALGQTIRLTSKTGTHDLRLVGVVAPAEKVPGQAGVFVNDQSVQQLSGLAGPTAVAVLAEPGATPALEKAAAGFTVYSGEDKARADLPGAVPDYISAISIFGFVLGITGFTAVFVLTGTISLAVRQRLRELALLRTIGATPRQLRRMLGLENGLVTLLAAVPALPLGLVAANLIAGRMRDLGAVPAQFTVSLNPIVLIVAAVLGLVVSQVATLVAARRTVKIAPTQALQETVTEARGGSVVRVIAAAVLAGGAAAVLVLVPMGGAFGMGMGFVSASLLLCAAAALGPVLVRALTAVVSRLVGLTGVTGRVAASMSRAEIRRIAGVAIPLTLMFAINATMLLNGDILTKVTADQQADRTSATTARVTNLPLGVANQVSALPQVTGSAATVPTRVVLNEGGKPEDHPAQGLRQTGEQSVLDLAVVSGKLTNLKANTLAASRPVADQRGWKVGDKTEAWMADGTHKSLTVVAIYDNWRGFGELVLPAELVAQHDPRGLVGTLYLAGTPDLAKAITATGLTVVGGTANEPADASNQQAAWELMVLISLGFTAIAVANTFALSTSARRREFAGLRLTGATAPQLHRMLGREAAITVAVALLIGCLITGIVVGAFSIAQDGQWRLFAEPARYFGLLAGVGALGVVTAAIPARLVVRRKSLPNL
ncbi:FtsX-like permease family protein [Kribbella sp. DT2]|uniref:ABC transporter permease n=1 Tax=Kribbella sp. DT2 TaxID=3393427 RepID=UPI003CED49F1